ncbi:MAG: hypothetical protein IPJ77_06170 [Planctomycetes bacterium]|nr:hypothetical protein [Planctomycetota bacterium]
MSTSRLVLVRFGALFAYLGAHWAGGRAIATWTSAFSSSGTEKAGLLDLVGSTAAAVMSFAVFGWCLLAVWRGYRTRRESQFARDRRSMADTLHTHAYETHSDHALAPTTAERSSAR